MRILAKISILTLSIAFVLGGPALASDADTLVVETDLVATSLPMSLLPMDELYEPAAPSLAPSPTPYQAFAVPRIRFNMGDAAFNASLVTLTALHVADFLSTREALKYPGLSEGNPLLKPIVKNAYVFAAVKAGISALTYLQMKSLYRKSKAMGWIATTVAHAALAYVVSNNYRLIERAKVR